MMYFSLVAPLFCFDSSFQLKWESQLTLMLAFSASYIEFGGTKASRCTGHSFLHAPAQHPSSCKLSPSPFATLSEEQKCFKSLAASRSMCVTAGIL